MTASDPSRLDCNELGRLLAAADPAALLVPPRLLRRVIKQHRHLPGFGLQVPHRKSYVIGRDALLALTEKDELELEPDRELPPTVLLLARPDADKLAVMPRDAALLKYWRLLFHARIDQHFEDLTAQGQLTPAAVRERVRRIGQTEFDEVRTVLQQEKYLLPPRNDLTVYAEFAAVYLELGFFATPLLPRYFPALEDFPRIDRILAPDVNGAALFAATRLAGAPDPDIAVDVTTMVGEEEGAGEAVASIAPAGVVADALYRALMVRADRAEAVGNLVRAALCRVRAARRGSPALAAEALTRARAHLEALVQRLQAAVHLDEAEVAEYRRALPALLDAASHGAWPAEARLLYDLQKVCIDCERPVFVSDLVEWVAYGFRRPLVRPLPNQPLVRAVKHLRSAFQRLRSVRLAEIERHQLAGLLHGTLHHAEARLRERFRPLMRDALREVGLLPANVPERVAFDKLIEELLDRVVEQGRVTMGDLRDALSRSDLKLPDLTGPGEFLLGDRLIRANRRLAIAADGVYRRGEIYLRWLQRLSAVAFGTRPGRFLTRYLALPFGGAFAVIVFVEEILHLLGVHRHVETPEPELDSPDDWDFGDAVEEVIKPSVKTSLLTPTETGAAVGVLGLFLVLLLYVPWFRARVVEGLRLTWRAARGVLLDLPAWIARQPLVRGVLASPPVLLFRRCLLRPLLAAGVAAAVCWGGGVSASTSVLVCSSTFLAAGLLFNSRLARLAEEAATDWLAHNWHQLRSSILPGLFHFTMAIFKRSQEALDRVLYAVDEWLRFRKGDSRLSLVVKPVLGLVWFALTYVIRIVINLFVEPTINPIKHFPTVTVAAKILFPVFAAWHRTLAGMFVPWSGAVFANVIAVTIEALIPGLAGFLVWELKENWKLYAATRSRNLRPEVIGHHGETMVRFLRPGFHSGTLPKLYAELRRAERRAHRRRSWRAARKQREALQHVEERIQHFFERELLALLRSSKGWGGERILVGGVVTGSNRVRVELACPQLGPNPLEVAFEERAGWLLAGIPRSGWLGRLTPAQVQVLTPALAGFYKLAGVSLVREQIAVDFRPAAPSYDVVEEGLVVWPSARSEEEVIYDLRNGPLLQPHVTRGLPTTELPVLPAARLLYDRVTISWHEWVEAWESEQAGKALPEGLSGGFQLLPDPRA